MEKYVRLSRINYRKNVFFIGEKANSPRENVHRKKLQSIWWKAKNYIFGNHND